MKIISLNTFYFTLIFLLGFNLLTNSLCQDKSIQWSNEDRCVKCHMEIDYMPANFTFDDIHMQRGLSCSGCHGGDPRSDNEEQAMSKKHNFIGNPSKIDIPQFCGKCHSDINIMRKYQPQIETDQVSQYYTSGHGIQLIKGDENVAECVSCHTSHNIYKISDPRSSVYPTILPSTCNTCHGSDELMKGYNLANDQYEKYLKSVHGISLIEEGDLGAPACNDCHGNHGAVPPEVESISHVCGTCHINNMNYFLETDMSRAFDEMNFHACEPCHGYHEIRKTSDEMIGGGENSVCLECHDKNDSGFLYGVKIKKELDNFVTLYDSATSVLVDVTIKGMNDAEIEYSLKEAKHKLIQSRTAVHSFDTSTVTKITREGIKLSNNALKIAEDEMDEYYRRRYGFLYTTIVFFLFGLALFLKIRLK